jgi:hypothetical protein
VNPKKVDKALVNLLTSGSSLSVEYYRIDYRLLQAKKKNPLLVAKHSAKIVSDLESFKSDLNNWFENQRNGVKIPKI